jgi:hypothetical protein
MPDIPPTQALSAVRIAIGLGGYAQPETTGKLFGFTATPETTYFGRLFAIRDLALGIGTLAAGKNRKLWLTLGLMCDAGDAAAGILGLQAGAPKRAMIFSTATATLAVGLGFSALTGARRGEGAAEESAAV